MKSLKLCLYILKIVFIMAKNLSIMVNKDDGYLFATDVLSLLFNEVKLNIKLVIREKL